MKHFQRTLYIFFLLGTTFHVSAQRSYDFAIPLPPSGTSVNNVSERYYGTYSCAGPTDVDYEFTAKGMFAVSWNFNSISRETIRESSKYRVSNGWLHGVVENDSVPCELEGEYYHFAVKTREELTGEDAAHVLSRISDRTYILNFEEGGHFTPSIFEFKGNELHVRHFSYEEGTTLFDVISEQLERSEGNLTLITLRPTKEEWEKLPIEAIAGERRIYLKKE
jgi:hypothetical protein